MTIFWIITIKRELLVFPSFFLCIYESNFGFSSSCWKTFKILTFFIPFYGFKSSVVISFVRWGIKYINLRLLLSFSNLKTTWVTQFKICENTDFYWPVFSCIRIESTVTTTAKLPETFCKKGAFKDFKHSQKNTCVRVSFSIKSQAGTRGVLCKKVFHKFAGKHLC